MYRRCINTYFHSYVDSLYSTELSYLDILQEKDSYGNLTTKLFDKRDDLIFSIVNFPYLFYNIHVRIPLSPA